MNGQTSESHPPDETTWGARFGWLLGGFMGAALGFVATWVLETKVLRGHVTDPVGVASRASSVLVSALFLAGALAGHGFGLRGDAKRQRWLAMSAGVLCAVGLWAVLVVIR
jgi:hypothetical protein